MIKCQKLQKQDARAAAGVDGGLVPDARLDLADVAGTDHQHAHAALADAAAHGQGQLAEKGIEYRQKQGREIIKKLIEM